MSRFRGQAHVATARRNIAKDSRAKKVSVSIPADDLTWAKSLAKSEHTSLSAVVSQALRLERQMRAGKKVIEKLGGVASTAEEREALRREWQG